MPGFFFCIFEMSMIHLLLRRLLEFCIFLSHRFCHKMMIVIIEKRACFIKGIFLNISKLLLLKKLMNVIILLKEWEGKITVL